MPDPTVSFDSPAITPVDTETGFPTGEADWYPVGNATIKLKLSEAAPKDATVTLSSAAIDQSYDVKFRKGAQEATKVVKLVAGVNLLNLEVKGKTACNPAVAKVQVGARNPRLKFADDPFEDSVTQEDGKGVFKPGDKFKLKVQLDYKAPVEAKGSISGRPLKSAKAFKFASGSTRPYQGLLSKGGEFVEVELASGDDLRGDHTLTLMNTENCLLGEKTSVTIKVAPPLTLNFVDGDNWIDPPKKEFCKGEKADIKVILNEAAPATANYGKIKVGAKEYEAEVAEGEKEGSVNVEFDAPNTKTAVTLTGQNNSKSGTNIKKNLTIHQENKIFLPSLTQQGPFFKGDVIPITVNLKYEAACEGVAGKLTSDLFNASYDVPFQAGSKEHVVEVAIDKIGTAKKGTINLAAEGNYRLEDSKKQIELALESVIEVSFKSGKPNPEGPFKEGDETTFTVKLKYPARENGTAATLKCSDVVVFDPVTADFKTGETEKEVVVTIKDVPKPTEVSAKEPKPTEITATLETQVSPYQLGASNATCKFKVQAAPSIIEVAFKSSKPEPAGPFYEGAKTRFTVKLSSGAREDGAVATLKCDDAFDEVPVEFKKGETEKEVEVTIKAVPTAKEVAAALTTNISPYREKSGNVESKFKIKPFPEIYFHSTPNSEGGRKEGDLYVFNNGDTCKLRVDIRDVPPEGGSAFKITCVSFPDKEFTANFTERGHIYVPVQFLDNTLTKGKYHTLVPVKLEAVQGCILSKTATEVSFNARVNAVIAVCFSSGEDWITPAGPYYVKDKVKIKLPVVGDPPPMDAKARLSGEAFEPVTVTVPAATWESETKFHEVEVTLTKKNTVSSSHEVKLDNPRSCLLGQLTTKTIEVKPATLAHIKSISSSGPFCQGDKFKLTVELTNPARAADKALVKIKAAEAGIFPQNAEMDNAEVYGVKFEEGATTGEVEVEIVRPADKARFLTANKKIKIMLEAVDESGVYLDRNNTYEIPLRPFPQVYFDTKAPIKDLKKPDEGIFKFRITQKPVLFAKLTAKPPQSGSTAVISGNTFGTDKTYEVVFAAEKTEDGETTAAEMEKEVPVEMVDVTTGTSEDLELAAKDGVDLRTGHSKLKVTVADCVVSLGKKWIGPKLDVYAVGDQVWVRAERAAKDDNNLVAGDIAKITSPAFGKDVKDKKKDRSYVVKFKQGEKVSDPLAVPQGVEYLSPPMGDGSYTKKGGGIRLMHASDDPQKVTLEGIGIYGTGDAVSEEVLVKEGRYLHFAAGLLEGDLEYVLLSKVKLTVNLTVPARKGTKFAITSPAFDCKYVLNIPKGKVTRSAVVVLANNAKANEKGEGTYEVFLERAKGNLMIKENDSALRGKLEVKILTPLVSFKGSEPIKPPVNPGPPGTAASVGLDAKITLNIVLSQPAPEGTVAKIVSYAFAGTGYKVEFDEGETAKEVEVHIKKGDANKNILITVTAEKNCLADSTGKPSHNQILVQVLPLPVLRFPYPPLIGGRLEEETLGAIGGLFGEDFPQDAPAIDDGERGEWIDPNCTTFVKDDKAKVIVNLSRPAPTGGAKGALKCKAFGSDYPVVFADGEQTKEIEITFAKAPTNPNQQITLVAQEGCLLASEFARLVQVYPDRPVYLPPSEIVAPLGNFIKDDKAVISVRLKYPAPRDGAKATLSGPFADAEVEFSPGEVRRNVQVTFTKEAKAEQEITLKKGTNTVLGTSVSHKVTVQTPEIGFDDPGVEDAENVTTGGPAWLTLKLDTPAPVKGCSVCLKSDAFRPEAGYILKVPDGEKTAGLLIHLNDKYEEGGTAKVTLSDPVRCKLGSAKELSLDIKAGPRIGFSKTKITPAATTEFEEGGKATLSIEPNRAPKEDLPVKIKSTAFGANVYVVILPKNKAAAVTQEVVFTRGLPKIDDKTPEQKIRLFPPVGWQADLTPDAKGKEEPNASVIVIKVKTPEEAKSTEECPYKQFLSIMLEDEEYVQQPVPPEPDPDLENPCNLHRVFITVKHGKAHGEEKRGPAKNGTFELVRDKNQAKDPASALACTPQKIPILQVVGGREFGDPHVKEPESSYHYTTIAIEVDKKDKYCDHVFLFNDQEKKPTSPGEVLTATVKELALYRDKRQHPMVFVSERVKGTISRAELMAARLQTRIDSVSNAVTAKLDDVKTRLTEAAPVVALTEEAKRQLDQIKDLFEPAGSGIESAQEAVVEQVEVAMTKRRSWAERYEWGTIIPEPRNVRKNIDVDDENKGTLFEFPVFQANQIWHEVVEKDEEEEEDGEGFKPVKIQVGSMDDEDDEEKKQGMGLIRDLMSALSFAMMKPRQYRLAVESCGVPITDTDTPAPPVDKLHAIIEVYPSDEFCLHYHFDPLLPSLKLGAEGKFYDPAKDGDEGIKSQKEEGGGEEETTEEEEKPEEEEKGAITLQGWQDDDEEEEEEDEEEDEEGFEIDDPEMGEGEGEGFVTVDEEPEREGGANFFLDAPFKKTKASSKTKKAPGEPHKPSRVFHPFGEEAEAEEEDENGLLKDAIAYFKLDEAIEVKAQTRSAKAEIDLDAASGGAVSDTQSFLDDNIFSVTGLGVELTRNGQTGPFYYKITKTIGASIQTVRAITAVFNGIASSCATVMSAFGWGVDFNVSFLEGDLSVYWGWKEYEDHRVFKWYSVNLDLNILTVSAEIYVGFKLSVAFIKFEALIYGKISISATLKAGFERQKPDTATPEWLDTWIGVLGVAALGARLVLIHDSVFKVDGAIKTGYELKFRISPGLADRFGVEYMVFWMGVTVECTFTVCFRNRTKVVPIIEGNPKELPWRRGAFPRRAANSWWNIKKVVNLAWSRAKYQHSRVLDRLTTYQQLQVDMLAARKNKPPKWAPYNGDLLGYQFESDQKDLDGLRDYRARKIKFETQWEECVEAFNSEQHSVRYYFSYILSERLNKKVSDIEALLNNQFIPRLKRLDELKKRIMHLNERVAEAEEVADESAGADPAMKQEADDLLAEEDLNISERIGKRPLYDLDGLIEEFRFYATKRTQW